MDVKQKMPRWRGWTLVALGALAVVTMTGGAGSGMWMPMPLSTLSVVLIKVLAATTYNAL